MPFPIPRHAFEWVAKVRWQRPCPSVKVPDVVWISRERWEALPDDAEASPFAPEICVKVVSSAHTDAEMEEKRRLYFEGGAREVWLCDEGGQMTFYAAGKEEGRGPG